MNETRIIIELVTKRETDCQMRPRRAGGRRRGILQPENYFAGWRFNFDNPQGFLPRRRPKIGRNYAAEEYFRYFEKLIHPYEYYGRKYL